MRTPIVLAFVALLTVSSPVHAAGVQSFRASDGSLWPAYWQGGCDGGRSFDGALRLLHVDCAAGFNVRGTPTARAEAVVAVEFTAVDAAAAPCLWFEVGGAVEGSSREVCVPANEKVAIVFPARFADSDDSETGIYFKACWGCRTQLHLYAVHVALV